MTYFSIEEKVKAYLALIYELFKEDFGLFYRNFPTDNFHTILDFFSNPNKISKNNSLNSDISIQNTLPETLFF